MGHMIDRSNRLRSATLAALALAATAALAAAPPGRAARGAAPAHPNAAAPAKAKPEQAKSPPVRHGEQTDQGVVQSVSANAIVLKELDGSSVSVPVNAQTRVLVDGRPALLREVKPGFVAIAKWKDGKPAHDLRAFDLASDTIVQSVLAHAVVVTSAGGGTVTIKVNAKTRVFIDGKPAKLNDVKPGFIVVAGATGSKGGKPASELRVLNPS
jgi:hypothetical protein